MSIIIYNNYLAYKVLRIGKDNRPFFLFHGLNRSRKIKTNTWLEAEEKMVIDGSGQTPYLSGFSYFGSPELVSNNENIGWLDKYKYNF